MCPTAKVGEQKETKIENQLKQQSWRIKASQAAPWRQMSTKKADVEQNQIMAKRLVKMFLVRRVTKSNGTPANGHRGEGYSTGPKGDTGGVGRGRGLGDTVMKTAMGSVVSAVCRRRAFFVLREGMIHPRSLILTKTGLATLSILCSRVSPTSPVPDLTPCSTPPPPNPPAPEGFTTKQKEPAG